VKLTKRTSLQIIPDLVHTNIGNTVIKPHGNAKYRIQQKKMHLIYATWNNMNDQVTCVELKCSMLHNWDH